MLNRSTNKMCIYEREIDRERFKCVCEREKEIDKN